MNSRSPVEPLIQRKCLRIGRENEMYLRWLDISN